jgi:Zn-dependent M28 family amino/carboxypeptidase
MSTIKEEREALVAVLEREIPDTNIHGYWPRSIDCPAILIRPVRRIYDEFARPYRAYEIDILTIQADEEESQMELDAYLDEDGDYSIIAALERNPTLDGAAGNIFVEGWGDYDGKRTEVVQYIGATITVHLYPG